MDVSKRASLAAKSSPTFSRQPKSRKCPSSPLALISRSTFSKSGPSPAQRKRTLGILLFKAEATSTTSKGDFCFLKLDRTSTQGRLLDFSLARARRVAEEESRNNLGSIPL